MWPGLNCLKAQEDTRGLIFLSPIYKPLYYQKEAENATLVEGSVFYSSSASPTVPAAQASTMASILPANTFSMLLHDCLMR